MAFVLETPVMVKLKDGKPIKPPEMIKYLLVLFYSDGDKSFEIITGREEAFNFIRDNFRDIDAEDSQILSETATMGDCLSIREFFEMMGPRIDPDFDIEDYI